MKFLTFIQENLAHVLPVLVAGAVAVAVVIERSQALFLKYSLRNAKGFFEAVSELILAGRNQDAVALCEKQGDKPAAKIVKTALLRAHLPMEAVEQGLALTHADMIKLVQKRTPILATVANVAVLLGLFGTISGLIFSFDAVGHADPQQKSALLSAGIATAMNATMLGLSVAIPSMVAFAILTARSNRLIQEMDEAAARSVDALKLRYYAPEALNDGATSNVTPIANGKAGNGAAAELRRVA
jgi:biopolymer transport protein ExbB